VDKDKWWWRIVCIEKEEYEKVFEKLEKSK